MSSNLLVQRYAQAVFSLAAEHGRQRQVTEELNGFDRLLKENQELRACLFYPFIPSERKVAVIDELCARVFSPLTRNFLKLLIAKRRETILAEVTSRMNELLKESLGIRSVRLTSALVLTLEQENAVSRRLAQLFNRQVELEMTVDASLLGGIVIQAANRLTDGSCRGQLEKIRYELSRN